MKDSSDKGATRARNEAFLKREHAKKVGLIPTYYPYYDHTYPPPHYPQSSSSSSGFGHGIGQRSGSLRVSGKPGAHRIGKR